MNNAGQLQCSRGTHLAVVTHFSCPTPYNASAMGHKACHKERFLLRVDRPAAVGATARHGLRTPVHDRPQAFRRMARGASGLLERMRIMAL